MAHGKSAHETCGAVRSTVDSLEISPSHHSGTSPIASGGSRAVGHGVSEKTGKFASQPSGRFGKKTRKVKENFGKKSHSSNKTSGR